jgi:ankyrin repeat protein
MAGSTTSIPRIPTGITHDFASLFSCNSCPKGNVKMICEGGYCNLSAAFKAQDVENINSMIAASKHSTCLRADRRTGFTALHLAAKHGIHIVVDRLAESGLDINALDYNGNTPLMIAVINFNVAAARALLSAGADANMSNVTNRSPLHEIAFLPRHDGQTNIQQEMLELFFSWGTRNFLEINQFDNWWNTPVDYALWMNHKQVALDLIGHGALTCTQERAQKLGEFLGIHSFEHASEHSPFQDVIRRRDIGFLSQVLKARFIDPDSLDIEQKTLANCASKYFSNPEDSIHSEIEQIFSEIRQSRADFAHANSFNETTANVLA